MRLRLLVASLMLTTSVYASPVKYTCEDAVLTKGILPSWESVLDMDYHSGELNSFTLKGKVYTDFDTNNDALENFNSVKPPSDAPAIVVFQKDIDRDAVDGFMQLIVFGKTGGVEAGDVIMVIPAFKPMSYYCYKQGSNKDKLMSELREEHNKRVTGQ